jgi:capsular polysaccharide biosynthesis protein
MKAIKIILLTTLVVVIGFSIGSWSIVTDRLNATPLIASSNPTALAQDVTRTNELKNAFWRLIQSGNTTKEPYDSLIKRYGNNKKLTSEEKDIIIYLKRICINSKSFEKYVNIPEIKRKKATTLTELSID